MVQPVELLLQPGAKPLRSRPQRSASHLPQEQSRQPCSAQVPQDCATCFRSASRARKAHTLSLLAEIPVATAKSFNIELIVPGTDLAGTDFRFAEVVVHRHHQVGLVVREQARVAHGCVAVAGRAARPDDAERAFAQQGLCPGRGAAEENGTLS